MKSLTQRDAFWKRIYELAKTDRRIVVVSEDMGAPALDDFRLDLPAQFVNVGIAEQNGLLVAGGLALEGKRPFVYAIAPFVGLRCLEQIRVTNSIMHIPVTIVGVGAGFGYEDSGPTHHLTEDIAVMRAFPDIDIFTPADGMTAAATAELACKGPAATRYVRLDRQPMPELYTNTKAPDFDRGFAVLREGADGCILATGIMTHTALQVAKRLAARKKQYSVVDVFRLPANEPELVRVLDGCRHIVTIEEHFLPGGFGSYILEMLNDNRLAVPVQRIGLPMSKGYCYVYGGRNLIHRYYGVETDQVVKAVVCWK